LGTRSFNLIGFVDDDPERGKTFRLRVMGSSTIAELGRCLSHSDLVTPSMGKSRGNISNHFDAWERK
jgi:hypothetical protein